MSCTMYGLPYGDEVLVHDSKVGEVDVVTVEDDRRIVVDTVCRGCGSTINISKVVLKSSVQLVLLPGMRKQG